MTLTAGQTFLSLCLLPQPTPLLLPVLSPSHRILYLLLTPGLYSLA